MVVDQMRADYLDRFEPLFGDGGFKRLMNSGFQYRNTRYSYIPTYTGPGHACIATGTVPAVNGIVANHWYMRNLKRKVYCVEDNNVRGIGLDVAAGKMSPVNLLSTTFSHEFKLARPHSKSVAVALKDRAAILSAGHFSDGVYWMEDSLGYFISSSFYCEHLPDWVEQFNKQNHAAKLLQQDWDLLLPASQYAEVGCTADDVPYESTFKGESKPVFPHRISRIASHYNRGLLKSIPAGNTLTLMMAKAAINGEKLGQRGVSDLLLISFSPTDYLGHKMGIRSVELADMYARLDRDLAEFFSFLDATLGPNTWNIVLTADHGGAENPTFMSDHRLPAEAISTNLKTYFNDKYKQIGLAPIAEYENLQIYFNPELFTYTGVNGHSIKEQIIQECFKFPFVAHIFTREDLICGSSTLPWLHMLARAYLPDRSGDVFIIPKPHDVEMSWQKTGTSHGSAYPHDSHVPFVLYGVGIRHGVSYEACGVEDIAVTLAEMFRTPWPGGAIGQPRMQHLEKNQ